MAKKAAESKYYPATGTLEAGYPVVEIKNLSFSWVNTTSPVVEIGSFIAQQGERLFLHGPSGSGKSTLLSIITGILVPQRGEVEVLGKDISQLSGPQRDRYRAANIGYIFQMFNLIPYLSVVENVLLPCHFSTSRRYKALEQSQSLRHEALRLLSHLKLNSPEQINKPVTELSVGQQQRVAAARALIGSPRLIIADEPTSSLDAEHREVFLKLLFDECAESGATLLFVSHDQGLGRLFDRVIDFRQLNEVHTSHRESV